MSAAAPSPDRRSRRLAGSNAQAVTCTTTIEGNANLSSTIAPTRRTDGDAAIVGLADSVEIAGFKPPRFLWFVLSGGAGDVLMFMLDWLLKAAVLPPEYATPSICWAISYTASISWRHMLHTFLVFGGSWTSLYAKIPETYAAYTFGIAFSTAMNWALTAETVGLVFLTWASVQLDRLVTLATCFRAVTNCVPTCVLLLVVRPAMLNDNLQHAWLRFTLKAWPRRWAFFATLYTTAVLNFLVLKKVNAARAAAEAAKNA